MAQVAKIFDKVYSYQKSDCIEYDYDFITNYIYKENYSNDRIKYAAFFIFYNDFRLPIISKLGKYFHDKNLSYKFIIVDIRAKNNFKPDYLEVRKDYLYLNDVNRLMEQSKILVDIQRNDQAGLSFRPFEALGFNKKLITNNSLIKKHDFYNPNNIFILDENSINILLMKKSFCYIINTEYKTG